VGAWRCADLAQSSAPGRACKVGRLSLVVAVGWSVGLGAPGQTTPVRVDDGTESVTVGAILLTRNAFAHDSLWIEQTMDGVLQNGRASNGTCLTLKVGKRSKAPTVRQRGVRQHSKGAARNQGSQKNEWQAQAPAGMVQSAREAAQGDIGDAGGISCCCVCCCCCPCGCREAPAHGCSCSGRRSPFRQKTRQRLSAAAPPGPAAPRAWYWEQRCGQKERV
jgi:hypothetical protein